jgi:hypothetical protein
MKPLFALIAVLAALALHAAACDGDVHLGTDPASLDGGTPDSGSAD